MSGNTKVLQGNLKDLSEIPPCGLVDAFSANLAYLSEALHDTFLEGIAIRIPKRTPTQYQYQSQKQEQEPSALSHGPVLAHGQSGREGAVQFDFHDLVCKTLRHVSSNLAMPELVENVRQFATAEGVNLDQLGDPAAVRRAIGMAVQKLVEGVGVGGPPRLFAGFVAKRESRQVGDFGGGNPVTKTCGSCGERLLPPRDVRVGRRPEYCSLKCRRRREFWGRRARRWELLADEWKQVGSAGALESAARCEARAAQLRARGQGA